MTPIPLQTSATTIPKSTQATRYANAGFRRWIVDAASGRADQVLNAYRKAFTCLSEEELLILNGIVPRRR